MWQMWMHMQEVYSENKSVGGKNLFQSRYEYKHERTAEGVSCKQDESRYNQKKQMTRGKPHGNSPGSQRLEMWAVFK